MENEKLKKLLNHVHMLLSDEYIDDTDEVTDDFHTLNHALEIVDELIGNEEKSLFILALWVENYQEDGDYTGIEITIPKKRKLTMLVQERETVQKVDDLELSTPDGVYFYSELISSYNWYRGDNTYHRENIQTKKKTRYIDNISCSEPDDGYDIMGFEKR